MYWWTVFRCCVTVFVKDWLWRSHLDIGFANWLIYPLAAKYPCAVFLRKRDRLSELDKFKCLKVGGWLLILPLCEIKSCGVVHCVKSVQIRSYVWSVFSCIQPEYRKIRSRNNSVFGHFSRSGTLFVHKNNETKNNPDLQYKVDHQERDMFSVLDKQNYLNRAGKGEASPSLSTANPKVYII